MSSTTPARPQKAGATQAWRQGVLEFLDWLIVMETLGIYVQVPFCQTKCTYCNFHTGVVSTTSFAPYVEAVCREIEEHRQLLANAGIGWPGCLGRLPRRTAPRQASDPVIVDTVYIGGGTPSLLEPALLQHLLDAIRASFTTDLREVTLEADPETITPGKAEAWLRAGINRISFGVQSFVDRELIAAGRMHRREDVYQSSELLHRVGFHNLSFDLIAGLPYQNAASWRQSLDELIALRPEHVSVYLLEIDEGSRLGLEVLQGGKRYSAASLPSEDEMADFYEQAQAALAAAGYHHYEISNWALPGFESRHNLKYWRREPYLGFGAGAHSFSGSERWANAHDAARYVAAIESGGLPKVQHETVSREQALDEELFLGLRRLDGIDIAEIERCYGVALAPRIEPLAKSGWLEQDGTTVRLTPSRLSVSNEVFVELLQ
jgi:oxygen-independent coproporphyrinogen III oxidase